MEMYALQALVDVTHTKPRAVLLNTLLEQDDLHVRESLYLLNCIDWQEDRHVF